MPALYQGAQLPKQVSPNLVLTLIHKPLKQAKTIKSNITQAKVAFPHNWNRNIKAPTYHSIGIRLMTWKYSVMRFSFFSWRIFVFPGMKRISLFFLSEFGYYEWVHIIFSFNHAEWIAKILNFAMLLKLMKITKLA